MGAVLSARHEAPADLLDDAVQLIVKDIEQVLSEDQHQAVCLKQSECRFEFIPGLRFAPSGLRLLILQVSG
jgi:hypothetical protein